MSEPSALSRLTFALTSVNPPKGEPLWSLILDATVEDHSLRKRIDALEDKLPEPTPIEDVIDVVKLTARCVLDREFRETESTAALRDALLKLTAG